MARPLRLLLAIVLGFVVGSVVNMALVTLGGQVVPPPGGADVSTMEGLKAALPAFGPQHFVFPFLAHALGTLAGGAVAGFVMQGRAATASLVVGALFLLGGLTSVFMLPSPLWFAALDLTLAYLPAAWLGWRIARRFSPAGQATA